MEQPRGPDEHSPNLRLVALAVVGVLGRPGLAVAVVVVASRVSLDC